MQALLVRGRPSNGTALRFEWATNSTNAIQTKPRVDVGGCPTCSLGDDQDVSRQQLIQNIPSHVGQSVLAAVVRVGEAFVVDAHQVQHCGVQVVDGDGVDDRLVADVVGFAETGTAFDASARHPGDEALGVVVSAVFTLGDWHAAEFSAPDDQR